MKTALHSMAAYVFTWTLSDQSRCPFHHLRLLFTLHWHMIQRATPYNHMLLKSHHSTCQGIQVKLFTLKGKSIRSNFVTVDWSFDVVRQMYRIVMFIQLRNWKQDIRLSAYLTRPFYMCIKLHCIWIVNNSFCLIAKYANWAHFLLWLLFCQHNDSPRGHTCIAFKV